MAQKKERRMRRVNLIIALVSILQLFSSGQLSLVRVANCQDFEDLNHQGNQRRPLLQGANQQLQHTFQPLSRHQVSASSQPVAKPANNNSLQRPTLSSRFAPNGGQILAQASSSSAVFSSPQQVAPAQAAPSGATQAQSNIELMMKNALARTAKLNSDSALEAREDVGVAVPPPPAPPVVQSALPVAQERPVARAAPPQAQEKQAESGPLTLASPADGQEGGEESKSTTLAEQPTTSSGHETVYSEQRFANLFARRNNLKKSRINPQEQVKAKPTLPAFIKSPPDPKQFGGAGGQDNKGLQPETSNVRPAVAASTGQFGSQRIQNQSGRLNQQKKAVAATASSSKPSSSSNPANKRSNGLANGNARQNNSNALASAASSAAGNGPKSQAAKLSSSAAAGNPFNKSQTGGGDPASVIAMARKRLLAQNANESAKLKLQQSRPAARA